MTVRELPMPERELPGALLTPTNPDLYFCPAPLSIIFGIIETS